MPAETPEQLHDALTRKDRELALVLAIDHIRDTMPEPSAMLIAIANRLAEGLKADLCVIGLRDRETGALEIKAVNDRADWFDEVGVTEEKATAILGADKITVYSGDEAFAALGLRPEQELVAAKIGDGLHLAVVPIIVGSDTSLGALLLVRFESSFDVHDLALLKTIESQIDSAVIQGYSYYDLEQRTKELETIYRIDRIRDQQRPFDDMLHIVLQELCAVIQAEIGYVMLYDRAGKRLDLRAVTDEDLIRSASHYQVVDLLANTALQRAELVYDNEVGQAIRSLMCIPLILQNEIIGVLGVGNHHGQRGFDAQDRRMLSAIASQMDTAIFESLERRRLRQVLGRSVDPRVMERLLENPDVGFLEGERTVLTVLYADMRGSTNLAERTAPELLVGFINEYLARMTDVILAHEGTLDKFVGDEVMALFGAPFPQADHALRAVRVGLEMQQAHEIVMQHWEERAIEPAPIGVGIATGELIVGEMGSAQRTDYTVIGRAANLGSRICSVAKGGQVLVSQATYDLIKEEIESTPIPGLRLKGVDQDVTAYHVLRVR